MRKLLLYLLLAVVSAYPKCNDLYEQHEYYENERQIFNVTHDRSPFDLEYFHDTTRFHHTTCIVDEKIQRITDGSCQFIMKYSYLDEQTKLRRISTFDSLAWKFTDSLWYLSGWTRLIENGEHYWYYPNETSNRTVFYLHGINVLNGFENIILLRKLTRHASVYASVYSPILYFDADYEYNHTYSQHIDNVATFIREHKTIHNDIIGNSYGSIRITTICKRYLDICDKMDNIVLTDPLTINLPFSRMFDACLYGIFFTHPNKTHIYHQSMTINTLRLERHYMHVYNYMDWSEWTIDSIMLKRFAHNMVLVIGEQDGLIDINRDSPAMNLCRVIYTDTQHGFVIFTDFMDQVYETAITVHP